MIVLTSKDIAKREFPSISRDELEKQLREAMATYNHVQAQKTEIDRVFMAAALELNRLERLMNKAKRRDMLASR